MENKKWVKSKYMSVAYLYEIVFNYCNLKGIDVIKDFNWQHKFFFLLQREVMTKLNFPLFAEFFQARKRGAYLDTLGTFQREIGDKEKFFNLHIQQKTTFKDLKQELVSLLKYYNKTEDIANKVWIIIENLLFKFGSLRDITLEEICKKISAWKITFDKEYDAIIPNKLIVNTYEKI